MFTTKPRTVPDKLYIKFRTICLNSQPSFYVFVCMCCRKKADFFPVKIKGFTGICAWTHCHLRYQGILTSRTKILYQINFESNTTQMDKHVSKIESSFCKATIICLQYLLWLFYILRNTVVASWYIFWNKYFVKHIPQ